jgi:hypothetical protein
VAGASNPNAAHITCYKCRKQGHIQADCVDEPFCVNCKKVGHLSAMCAALAKVLPPSRRALEGGARVSSALTCQTRSLSAPPPTPLL